jgi:hypothetical protein
LIEGLSFPVYRRMPVREMVTIDPIDLGDAPLVEAPSCR